MPTTLETLASELGTTPQAIGEALTIANARANKFKLDTILSQFRSASAAALAADREAVQPTLDAIDAREARHRSFITVLESLRGEADEGQSVTVPTQAEIDAALV